MAQRKIYFGSVGPFLYDDADLVNDQDGDFPAETRCAVLTDGRIEGVIAAAGIDITAIHVNVAAEILGIAQKLIPDIADILVIEDSAAGWAKKRIQIGDQPFEPLGAVAAAVAAVTAALAAAIAAHAAIAGAHHARYTDVEAVDAVIPSIVCYGGDAVSYEEEVVTYE